MRIIGFVIMLFLVFVSNAQDSTQISFHNLNEYRVYPYFSNNIDENLDFYEKCKYIQLEDGRIVLNERCDMPDSLRKLVDRTDKFSVIYVLKPDYEGNISPPIDPLPDGKYVQYYAPIMYMDKDTIKFVRDLVHCFFHLKNNMLEGPAYWYAAQTNELFKAGNYKEGKRNGKWVSIQTKYVRTYSKELFGYPFRGSYADSKLTTEAFYVNGVKEGLQVDKEDLFHKKRVFTIYEYSHFHEDKLSGAYSVMAGDVQFVSGHFKEGEKSGEWFVYGLYKTKKVLLEHYKMNDDKTPGKSTLLRVSRSYRDYTFNYDDQDVYYNGYKKEKKYFGLTESSSNELSTMFVINHRNPDELSASTPLYEIIDSFGYVFLYTEYERFYWNGVFNWGFKLKNGSLENEGPVYNSKGKIRNSIEYNKEKNQYIQSFYKNNGKIRAIVYYDSIGRRIIVDDNTRQFEMINGRMYTFDVENSYYAYYNFDNVPLKGKDSLYLRMEVLYGKKKELNERLLYNLEQRMVVEDHRYDEEYRFFDSVSTIMRFDSLFKTYSCLKNYHYKNMLFTYEKKDILLDDSVTTINDILFIQPENVIEQKNVLKFYYKNEPFSGKVTVYRSRGKTKVVKRRNHLKVYLYENRSHYNYRGDVRKYLSHCLPVLQDLKIRYTNFDHIADSLCRIGTDLYNFKEIEIPYTNGEINGNCYVKNRNGQVLAEIPVKNNKIDGELKTWLHFSNYLKIAKQDTLDQDYYLTGILSYKNGLKQGFSYELNDYCDTVQKYFYSNDTLEGVKCFYNDGERSFVKYEHGIKNGESLIVDPGGVILQKINYKDGELNGKRFIYDNVNFYYSVNRYDKVQSGTVQKPLIELNYQNDVLHDSIKLFNKDYSINKVLIYENGMFKQEILYQEGAVRLKFYNDTLIRRRYGYEDYFSAVATQKLRHYQEFRSSLRTYYYIFENEKAYVNDNSIRGGVDGRLPLKNGRIEQYNLQGEIAETGNYVQDKKVGVWHYNVPYQGKYMVDYSDSFALVNDTVKLKTTGHFVQHDSLGNVLSKRYVLNTESIYNCGENEHYEIVSYYVYYEKDSSLHLKNGLFKTYYPNGVKQSEGTNKNGLPTGLWKFYNDNGSLREMGYYFNGFKTGRWLSGDLSKIHYMGDICMDLDNKDVRYLMKDMEGQLDIIETYYQQGEKVSSEIFRVVR